MISAPFWASRAAPSASVAACRDQLTSFAQRGELPFAAPRAPGGRFGSSPPRWQQTVGRCLDQRHHGFRLVLIFCRQVDFYPGSLLRGLGEGRGPRRRRRRDLGRGRPRGPPRSGHSAPGEWSGRSAADRPGDLADAGGRSLSFADEARRRRPSARHALDVRATSRSGRGPP